MADATSWIVYVAAMVRDEVHVAQRAGTRAELGDIDEHSTDKAHNCVFSHELRF